MVKDGRKTLVLLDTHAIIHRAYHALPDFSSSKGEPTGALYGLMLMLFKIIEQFKPDYIAACFDLPKPTYRHEAYKEYKAGRKKTDDELVAQLIKSREVFKALSIPMYDKEGFEADDMLGTIVEKMSAKGGSASGGKNNVNIIIASGDMDTMQLVDENKVKVFTLRKGIKDTIVYGEKEVRERFGFEPKYLVDYKGLRGDPSDNIIGIKGIGEKTATSLIQKFGTIENIYKAIGKSDKKAFKDIGISERVFELIKENKEEALFSKMLATIRRDAPIDFKLPDSTWASHVDVAKVKQMLTDLDFRSLVPKVETILGASKDINPPNKLTSSLAHQLPEADKLKIATWLLNSTITNPEESDILIYSKTGDIKDAEENIKKQIKEKGLSFVYESIELPLIPIIKKMHDVGVAIDAEYLKELGKKYHKMLNGIEVKIFKLADKEFNVASPKQLGEILFDHLKLEIKNHKKTGGGAKSTKGSELEKLRDMDHRELSKLLGTYIDLIPTLIKDDGRIHPTFIQTGAATGRMASTDPAVQNIPIKTELGRAIRDAFIAKKGFVLVAFDYSQIELRIAAILSGDKKLVKIFEGGEDVHTAVASQVFGVSLDKVDKEMRRQAKVINFGILYGMGVNALKANLGSTREVAQKFYADYFKTFSTLANYLDEVKKAAARDGFVTTIYGRRRYFEGIKSHLPFIRAAAERMAINAPMQGSQADIVKLAMIEIDKLIRQPATLTGEEDARLLLQIHDELIYEIKENKVRALAPKIKKIMEGILPKEKSKGVPIVANASAGKNWGEMETISTK